MSQQINLLPRAPHAPTLSARRAVAGMLVWAITLGVQVVWQVRQADDAQRAADASELELKQQKQMLLALQTRLGESANPNNIAAQIAALEPQTRVSRDLLARLKAGDLGSLDGYGAQLTELAMLPRQGVWVTQVAISNAGRGLRVEGRGLRKEHVLPYAAALNDAMKKYGAQLNQMEIVPLQPNADDDLPTAPVFNFKLY